MIVAVSPRCQGYVFQEGNMTITKSTSISEIATTLPQATRVFENLRIDYCCGGSKPLEEACATAGVSFERVVEMLESARPEVSAAMDPQSISLIRLIMHILDKHHVYTKQEMGRLEALLPKVIAAHGRNHKELLQVAKLFRQLCDELKPHMFKEEQILFPYIVQLERAIREKTRRPIAPFGSAANPIQQMAGEHEEAGGILLELRKATNDYSLPTDACSSFQMLYEGLEAFEEDLHQHIHLENNVLFPRSIQMEDHRT
jgi:regulator of cell morphogenesis and NO signaling